MTIKVVVKTNEVVFQLFGPTENIFSGLTRKFKVQSDIGNNYILVSYHYDANNIITAPLKKVNGPCILNGITRIHYKLRNK